MMHDFADDLLVDSKPSTMADEIGLGSVFIRQTTLGVDKTESRSHSVEDPYHTRVQNNGAPLQQLPNGTERLTSVRGKEKAKEYKKVDSGHLKATNTLL